VSSFSPPLAASQAIVRWVPAVQRSLRRGVVSQSAGRYTLAQYRLLAHLRDHAGLCLKDLAEREALEPPTVLRTLDVLVDRGWVTRHADDHDRRLVRHQLTDVGTALVDEARHALALQVSGALADWTEDDLAASRRLLERLALALRPQEAL